MNITIRHLQPADKAAWHPLWKGYQHFYKTDIPEEVSDLTWERFHDPAEPMTAFGAFDGDRLVGIVHAIMHRSCWTSGDYCYLQDLFTSEEARGKGVGRKLIEKVCEWSKANGGSRVHWLTQHDNAQARILYDAVATNSGFIQYRILF